VVKDGVTSYVVVDDNENEVVGTATAVPTVAVRVCVAGDKVPTTTAETFRVVVALAPLLSVAVTAIAVSGNTARGVPETTPSAEMTSHAGAVGAENESGATRPWATKVGVPAIGWPTVATIGDGAVRTPSTVIGKSTAFISGVPGVLSVAVTV
jgi:hypothetical protein